MTQFNTKEQVALQLTLCMGEALGGPWGSSLTCSEISLAHVNKQTNTWLISIYLKAPRGSSGRILSVGGAGLWVVP